MLFFCVSKSKNITQDLIRRLDSENWNYTKSIENADIIFVQISELPKMKSLVESSNIRNKRWILFQFDPISRKFVFQKDNREQIELSSLNQMVKRKREDTTIFSVEESDLKKQRSNHNNQMEDEQDEDDDKNWSNIETKEREQKDLEEMKDQQLVQRSVLNSLASTPHVSKLLFDSLYGDEVIGLIRINKELQTHVPLNVDELVFYASDFRQILNSNLKFPKLKVLKIEGCGWSDKVEEEEEKFEWELTKDRFPSLKDVRFIQGRIEGDIKIESENLRTLVIAATFFGKIVCSDKVRDLRLQDIPSLLNVRQMLPRLKNLEVLALNVSPRLDNDDDEEENEIPLRIENAKLKVVDITNETDDPLNVIIHSISNIEELRLSSVDCKVEIFEEICKKMRVLIYHNADQFDQLVKTTQFPNINYFSYNGRDGYRLKRSKHATRIFQNSISGIHNRSIQEYRGRLWIKEQVETFKNAYLYCNSCFSLRILNISRITDDDHRSNIFIKNVPNLTKLSIGEFSELWHFEPNTPLIQSVTIGYIAIDHKLIRTIFTNSMIKNLEVTLSSNSDWNEILLPALKNASVQKIILNLNSTFGHEKQSKHVNFKLDQTTNIVSTEINFSLSKTMLVHVYLDNQKALKNLYIYGAKYGCIITCGKTQISPTVQQILPFIPMGSHEHDDIKYAMDVPLSMLTEQSSTSETNSNIDSTEN